MPKIVNESLKVEKKHTFCHWEPNTTEYWSSKRPKKTGGGGGALCRNDPQTRWKRPTAEATCTEQPTTEMTQNLGKY